MSDRAKFWIAVIVICLAFYGYSEIQKSNRREELKQQGWVEVPGEPLSQQECIERGGMVDETANVCLLP